MLSSLTLVQPRNAVSPSVLSPVGSDPEENPFEAEFNAEYDDLDDDDDDDDDDLDFISPQPDSAPETYAVLNSSLPEQGPEPHHLTSYASARRTGAGRDKKQHRTKWHFGIRSRSPPMEVMLEIYRTLKVLGMEWKEKKNLGGLGGIKRNANGEVQGLDSSGRKIDRNPELDGAGYVDLKSASSIYFVETRARVLDVVVSTFVLLRITAHY